ncbi:hypothetical protein K440DRAFT_640061 [Wilcoxina mikolae CBS 423.85]|nr:hypothetical protein K440DRAFT_640061 [Wilcoxina mikolae CBS 423.85]
MLPGKPYYCQRASGELATIDDKKRVFGAVADVLIELKNHPFSQNIDKLVDNAKHQFYLKHVDDKGNHLLVDDELNVVGIIDWQFARVAPFAEAFGPSLVTADMGSMYGGKYGLSEDDLLLSELLQEKGATDLAYSSAANEKVRKFMFGLANSLPSDEALVLARGILTAFGVDEHVHWEEWKRAALEKYKEDERLQELLRWQDSSEEENHMG